MSWPCGKTKKFMRAHARGGKLGLRVIGLGGALWEGEWTRAHAHVDSQSPATGYWARCVLSARGRGYHEGATTFTHCRWAGEFWCWKIFSGRKLLFNVAEKQSVIIKRRNELASQVFEEQKRELYEEHFAGVRRPSRSKLEFSLAWSTSKSYEGDFSPRGRSCN